MAKKRRETYNDILRVIEQAQRRKNEERQRMANVMASALLAGRAASVLGDYSDADLKGVMALMAADIDAYVERYEDMKLEERREALEEGERQEAAGAAAKERDRKAAEAAAMWAKAPPIEAFFPDGVPAPSSPVSPSPVPAPPGPRAGVGQAGVHDQARR